MKLPFGILLIVLVGCFANITDGQAQEPTNSSTGIVTVVIPQQGFYLEEFNRSAGIFVQYPAASMSYDAYNRLHYQPPLGSLVTISYDIGELPNGELCAVLAAGTDFSSDYSEVDPDSLSIPPQTLNTKLVAGLFVSVIDRVVSTMGNDFQLANSQVVFRLKPGGIFTQIPDIGQMVQVTGVLNPDCVICEKFEIIEEDLDE